MKLTGYKLVVATTIIALQNKVIHNIANGWTPQGGVFVSNDAFYQAMVMKVER